MHPYFRTFLSATLVAASAMAQAQTWKLPSNCPSPVGVTWVGNDHVAISTHKDGRFSLVKDNGASRAPTATKTCLNPSYGDQWFEGEYTPAFGGRYVVAHRFGGINLIDVSNPRAATFGAVLHSRRDRQSKYHFRGKRFLTRASSTYLYYNEHNVSNRGGGLVVYQLTGQGKPGNRLTPCWNNLKVGTDANGLAILGNHAYQMGFENNRSTGLYLRTFDLTNACKPRMCNRQKIGGITAYSHNDMEESSFGKRILVAMGNQGLKCIDAKNPCKPVVETVFPAHKDIAWRGVEFFPKSLLAFVWGTIRVGRRSVPFWAFILTPPVGPCSLLTVVLAPIFTIDIAMKPDGSRIYIVGFPPKGGAAQLMIF